MEFMKKKIVEKLKDLPSTLTTSASRKESIRKR